MGHRNYRAYLDEKVTCFDNLSARTWSPLWFEKLNFALHYPKNPALHVYWLLLGKEMPDGLRLILSEKDTTVMASIVHRVKTFVLYFDHEGTTALTDWDDVVVNPIASLPKVISPSKFGRNNDARTCVDDNLIDHSDDSDDSDASEFVDSDYEIDDDDDAMFADNVDDDIRDAGVDTGSVGDLIPGYPMMWS